MNSPSTELFPTLPNGMDDPAAPEREVLAGMIATADSITDEYLDELQADDFLYYQHRCIFEAAAALRRDKLPVDEVTLQDELSRRGTLQDAGGMRYIIDVLLSTHVRTNWRGVVHLVKSHHTRRQTLELASQIAQSAINNDRDSIEKLLNAAQQLVAPIESNNRWTVMHATDLKDLPPIDWLLPGMIPARGLTTLYGRTGEGKSFYALDLSLQIAQTQTVVYIAAEGQAGYTKRVAAWCKHHGKTEGNLYFCMGAVNLMDKADARNFINAIAKHKPVLVVVDTLARTLIGGEENSNKDMGIYVDTCGLLTRTIGCAVLLVHHVGKSGYGPRGATSLPASSDQTIELVAEDDVIRVKYAKNKDNESGMAQYLSKVKVQTDYGESVVLIPAENVVRTPDDPLSQAQQLILTTFAKPLNADGMQSGDIEDQTQLTRATIAHALNRLIERNFIERVSRGIYKITADGIAALAISRSNDRLDRVDPLDHLIIPINGNDPRKNIEILHDQDDQLDQPELFPDGKRISYP